HPRAEENCLRDIRIPRIERRRQGLDRLRHEFLNDSRLRPLNEANPLRIREAIDHRLLAHPILVRDGLHGLPCDPLRKHLTRLHILGFPVFHLLAGVGDGGYTWGPFSGQSGALEMEKAPTSSEPPAGAGKNKVGLSGVEPRAWLERSLPHRISSR